MDGLFLPIQVWMQSVVWQDLGSLLVNIYFLEMLIAIHSVFLPQLKLVTCFLADTRGS